MANSSPPKRAAESRGARRESEPTRHRLEQTVPDVMTERVVDDLEPVDVEEQQGDLARTGLGGRGQLRLQPFHQADAVEQAGQLVVADPSLAGVEQGDRLAGPPPPPDGHAGHDADRHTDQGGQIGLPDARGDPLVRPRGDGPGETGRLEPSLHVERRVVGVGTVGVEHDPIGTLRARRVDEDEPQPDRRSERVLDELSEAGAADRHEHPSGERRAAAGLHGLDEEQVGAPHLLGEGGRRVRPAPQGQDPDLPGDVELGEQGGEVRFVEEIESDQIGHESGASHHTVQQGDLAALVEALAAHLVARPVDLLLLANHLEQVG